MEPKKSFTGHSRRRVTRLSVRLGEFLSRWIIRIGGIGTIAAVVMVGVFLVYVALPLFRSSTVTVGPTVKAPAPADVRLLRLGVDEYQLLSWALFSDGTLQVVRLDTGMDTKKELKREQLFPDEQLTACSPAGSSDELAFGFADGKVRVGRIGFKTEFVQEKDVKDEKLRALPLGAIADYEGGLLARTAGGKLRKQELSVEIIDLPTVKNKSRVNLIDMSRRGEGADIWLSFLTADGKLHTNQGVYAESKATLETIVKIEFSGVMDLPPRADEKQPTHLLVSGVGDNVFLAWDDGQALRVGTRDVEKPIVVEEFNLIGRDGVTLTALEFLVEKRTLLVGDSTGRVRAWFRHARPGAKDGNVMEAEHDLGSIGSPVTSIAVSSRTRMAVAGGQNGRFRLFYVTSEKDLADLAVPGGEPVQGILIAPKDDAILVRAAGSILTCNIDPNHHHPEVTLSSIFLPVWYEDYEKPANSWQTTGGDGYEPKFGFWPLIFGTLKATFYSLLMGVPIALLAAVYTSEFLNPRAKAVVKPTIEMMASLPSVVLGFLSALVLAPFVEHWLPSVLAAVLTIPAAFALGAYVWQLLPEKLGVLLSRYRFVFILAVLPAGLLGAMVAGPVLEYLLFQGDMKAWLNGAGSGTPGWLFLQMPLALVTTFVLLSQFVNPWVRHRVTNLSRFQHALVDVAKFLGAAVYTVGLAWGLALLLTAIGLDPRGTFVGTYVQRNALVVGFMMGFAIIPIIFTIAEDALSAVPEHLRSASLGCGATPWQTANRVIIPTAMSGLFSAVMVGLGRAVGETMVVLMAAGNTPIMEMNIFNGFRTLSANIAVELPEAVKDSTHYRTLFLAALTLFAMTFALNTLAEVIRQRFRRRAFQL